MSKYLDGVGLSDVLGRIKSVIPTVDATPTSGSTNAVSSGGTYTAIQNAIGSVYRVKGSKATYANLPSSGNITGDVWNVEAAYGDYPPGTNWVWTGSAWDALGGTIDLSAYQTTATADSKYVTALGTSGNNLTWTKNGTTNNITVPFATKASQDGNGVNIADTYIKKDSTNQNVLLGTGSTKDIDTFITTDKRYHMPTNAFGGSAKAIQQNIINNGMYAGSERFNVTLTGFSPNSHNAATLFDGNYETNCTVPAGETGVILIEAKSGTLFGSYNYGYTYLSFYYTSIPESVSMRIYGTRSGVVGWYSANPAELYFGPSSTNSDVCYGIFNGSIYSASKFEITIVAKENKACQITQIDHMFTRGATTYMSAVTKYAITQDLYGTVIAPKYIVRNGVASQFLKADGSLDSNTYLTTSAASSNYVSALGTSGNSLTWTKGGTTNNITIPFATTSTTATKLGSATVGSTKRPIYLNSGTATQVSTIDGRLIEGYIGYGQDGYVDLHPETTGGIALPYLFNDLAFLLKRGGHISIYSTSDEDLTANTLTVKTSWADDSTTSIDNIFDSSPSYLTFNNGTATEMSEDGIIIDITLPSRKVHGNKFYIDFGNYNFGFTKIDLFSRISSDSSFTTWVTEDSFIAKYFHKFNFGGNGANYIRIHLYGKPNTTNGVRIAQIGLIQYNSSGVRIPFMSRGMDDDVWRNISPATTKTYDLGGSNYRWNNIYGNTLNLSGSIASVANITATANISANAVIAGSFIKNSGTSSQFLKADGSVDSTSYATVSALSNKQDTLTFDTTPVASSTNPVTSGGLNTEFGKVSYVGDNLGTETYVDSGSVVTDLSGYATKAWVEAKGYLTTESDPGVYAWAKAATKPTYTASEVGALPDTTEIPSKLSDLTNDMGFIIGYTETDPVFAASPAHGITAADITKLRALPTFYSGTSAPASSLGSDGDIYLQTS